MAVEKLSKTGCLFVRVAGCVVGVAGLLMVIAVFLAHESIRIFLDLLANLRVILQICVQRGVSAFEFLIVYQGRVFAKLFGNFAMTVKELVEARNLTAGGVVVATATIATAVVVTVTIAVAAVVAIFVVTSVFPAIIATFQAHEGVRVFLYLLADLRVIC